MITKALFTINGFNNFYEGYSDESNTWNGWETPCFEKSVIEEMIKQDNDEEYSKFVYDENNDVYLEYDIGNDYTEEYKGHDIEVDGVVKHVYDIGAYSWIWSRYTEDEAENEINIFGGKIVRS